MWIHNLNPTLVDFGIVEIRWYGVVYVLGFFLAVWWLHFMKKKDRLSLTTDEIWDFAFYLMVGVIIGSRLFLMVWHPERYLLQPWNLLRIWEGGMSFHGGFVGIVAAAYWYCRKKQLNFLKMADILSIPAMLVLALGRLANFINGELWGRVWEGRWCVNFKNTGGGDVCRHPYPLYEASKRFVILGWLAFLSFKRDVKPGFIFWNFVFWEGLGRFLLDFVKEDPLLAGLTLGQWMSLVMVMVAGVVFWKYYKEDWRKCIALDRK